MYPYVSKKILHDSQTAQQLKSCQYINQVYLKKKYLNLFIYLFIIYQGKRGDEQYY